MTRLRAVALAAGLAITCGAALPAKAGRRAPLYQTTARITAYTQSGITASGTYTTAGRTAACSLDISLFSTVVLPNGDAYVCEDRGSLGSGSPSWVDIYTTGDWRWVPATYGDYTTIEVQ